MEKEFIPYEQALELKELGFDKPCFGEYRQWDGSYPYLKLYQDLDNCSTDPADYEYTTECTAPIFSQAFRWFREKYNLFMLMQVGQHNKEYQTFYFNIFKFGINLYKSEMRSKTGIYTYEEAELECLKKLIELVREK